MNAADLLKWYDDHIAAAESLRERYETAGLETCVKVQNEEIVKLQAGRALLKLRILRERIEQKEGER